MIYEQNVHLELLLLLRDHLTGQGGEDEERSSENPKDWSTEAGLRVFLRLRNENGSILISDTDSSLTVPTDVHKKRVRRSGWYGSPKRTCIHTVFPF